MDNGGDAFGKMAAQNTAAAGLTFSSGFTAQQISADTGALGSGTTMYFNAGSTFTVASFLLTGTSADAINLGSTSQGTRWHLNNAGAQAVSYVRVRDSDASAGNRIFDYPKGEDLGNNLNWAVGVEPPASLSASNVYFSSLTFTWLAADPAPDTYTFQTSPNVDFSSPFTSASTALLTATTSGLTLNTTYHARVRSVINGIDSVWTAITTTA
mgnify:CR=1 FL=1